MGLARKDKRWRIDWGLSPLVGEESSWAIRLNQGETLHRWLTQRSEIK
jgi:hypothetical protein